MWDEVSELCEKLKLPEAFLERIYDEDEWSFLIKTHALVETSINVAIERSIEDDRVSEFINRLSLSGGSKSKTELLKSLGIITQNEIQFVEGLSQIRNRVVHNIRHVEFTFTAFTKELNARNRMNLYQKLFKGISEGSEPKKKTQDFISTFEKDPKFVIFLCTLMAVAKVSLESHHTELNRTIQSTQDATNRLLMERLTSR